MTRKPFRYLTITNSWQMGIAEAACKIEPLVYWSYTREHTPGIELWASKDSHGLSAT